MNTFMVILCTDNNLLAYILASVKLDATGHHWVPSLANYNFAMDYKARKASVDEDVLSHILCGNHDQHIAADMVQVITSNAIRGTTLVEAYSCNIQVTETLDM